MLQDTVKWLQLRRETMIGLDEDAVVPRANNGIVARGMLDDSEVAFRIGNEEIFWYGTRDTREDA